MRQGGVQWIRAAVGVSVRWVSLLPPSLLQPRVSSMGCDGIRYSLNMQPKTRGGVLLGNELAPWIGPVQLTSVGEKKTTKVTKSFQLQVEQKVLLLFLCLQQNTKNSIHVIFVRDCESEGEEEWEILSVLSSSCPDAGLRNTFPICVYSWSPGWKVGGKERGRRTEGERECVSNSGVRLSQAGSVYWSKGSGPKQAELPLPGLISRDCAAPNGLAHSAIPLPLSYFGKDRQDYSLGWTSTYKKQVYGCNEGGGEWAGWGGVAVGQRWVGWDKEKVREMRKRWDEGNTKASLAQALPFTLSSSSQVYLKKKSSGR